MERILGGRAQNLNQKMAKAAVGNAAEPCKKKSYKTTNPAFRWETYRHERPQLKLLFKVQPKSPWIKQASVEVALGLISP
jgi:hypothetical protein